MENTSQLLVSIMGWIFVLGYPLFVALLFKKKRRAEIVQQSVYWFTGWCFVIVLVDMTDPSEPYQFGPIAFLFSIPMSALAGAVVGFVVRTILPKSERENVE